MTMVKIEDNAGTHVAEAPARCVAERAQQLANRQNRTLYYRNEAGAYVGVSPGTDSIYERTRPPYPPDVAPEDGGPDDNRRDPQYERIVEREFRKTLGLSSNSPISVCFDNEEIKVQLPGRTYIMQVGSDDDNFVFLSEDGLTTVCFDFPPDWVALEEQDDSDCSPAGPPY